LSLVGEEDASRGLDMFNNRTIILFCHGCRGWTCSMPDTVRRRYRTILASSRRIPVTSPRPDAGKDNLRGEKSSRGGVGTNRSNRSGLPRRKPAINRVTFPCRAR
jgi:hypothetical protein